MLKTVVFIQQQLVQSTRLAAEESRGKLAVLLGKLAVLLGEGNFSRGNRSGN